MKGNGREDNHEPLLGTASIKIQKESWICEFLSFGNNKPLGRINMAPFFSIQTLLSVVGILKAGW